MLKVYVTTNIRMREATDGFVKKLKKAKESQDGFASAEMIAIAVVGVLIVGGIYVVFQSKINDELGGLMDKIFNPSSSPSTPNTPAGP
jgi:hypothetical protein